MMMDFEHKLTWRGWLSFVFIVISFSGIVATANLLASVPVPCVVLTAIIGTADVGVNA